MAVTATFVRATGYRLFYAIAHDGLAGDSVTISNATLQADAAGKDHILAMLQTAVTSDAEAVNLLLAGGQGVAHILPGKEAFWSLDAQNNNGLAELVLSGQAATLNDGLLELQVLHTVNK